jgi:ABC-type Fe3+ transport system substrate-binding protein
MSTAVLGQDTRPVGRGRAGVRSTLTRGSALGLGVAMIWFSLLVLIPLAAIVATAGDGGWSGYVDTLTNPQSWAAITTDAKPAAQDFLDFQLSKEGQTLYAQSGFRPVISGVQTDVKGANDPSNPYPAIKKQYTIDQDFGGWSKANTEFFDDKSGIITKIISGLKIGS